MLRAVGTFSNTDLGVFWSGLHATQFSWVCVCVFALTADTLAQQTAAGILLEAERAVVPRERAVFQRWAEQWAYRLI